MLADIRAELLVLRKRPATWVLLGAWLALYLVFAYILPVAAYMSGSGRPDAGFTTADDSLAAALPGQLVPNALGGMPIFGGGIAVIFGALIAGSEYGWGTIKALLTQRAGRLAVVGSKLITVVIAALAAVLTSFVVGAVVSAGIAISTDSPITWPAASEILVGVLGGWLIMGAWTLFGAMLGFTFRNIALPIGLGVVWIFAVENLISSIAAQLVTSLAPVRDLLPAANAGALIAAMTAGTDLGDPAPGVTDIVSGGRATVTLLCYLLVFAGISAWLVRRRDVT
jgi:ABC-2 type transport system permease protein